MVRRGTVEIDDRTWVVKVKTAAMRSAALTTIAIFGLMAQASLACTCNYPPELTSNADWVRFSYASSALVVLVEVMETQDDEPDPRHGKSSRPSSHGQQAVLNVLKSWKGPKQLGDQLRIFTRGGYCGRRVQLGQQLLIYTEAKEPVEVNGCMRILPVAQATEDILLLDSFPDESHSGPAA